ncbi:hypothetical protein ABT297_09710 [Dactylosporangium sp. NPDC000555]|uniref:hypothetical protein n=1 Tax=Dactylosporangium sp. NPDC000555 TaxID=3154260 RepID=UPI00331708A5
MTAPRHDRSPDRQQEAGWHQPGWTEPERRMTGIVLPSFDDPEDPDDLDEVERDRRTRASHPQAPPSVNAPQPPSIDNLGFTPSHQTRPDHTDPGHTPSYQTRPDHTNPGHTHSGHARPDHTEPDHDEPHAHATVARAVPYTHLAHTPAGPAGPPVRVVPSGPPPAWPPLDSTSATGPGLPGSEPATPAVLARPRREFPRYIHGELVLPADASPAPHPATPPEVPERAGPAAFDPLTAPVDALSAHLHAAQPSTSDPRARQDRERAPVPPEPQYATVEPVTGPPADPAPAAATWAPQPAVPPRPAELPEVQDTARLPVTQASPPQPSVATPDGRGADPAVPNPESRSRRAGTPHPAFPEATAHTFRILPIAADLLPLEISETRHVRRLRRLVISGVVLVAALVVGWYGIAVHSHTQAQQELRGVLDTKQDLTRERHRKYDDLTRIQGDSKKIDERLQKLLDRDLSWSKVLASLRQTAAAKNVKITGITGSLSQETGTAPANRDTVGLITLTGTAPSKAVVATYVDALSNVDGIANPFPTDAMQEDGGVAFTIRMDITRAALGGRFTSPSASPSGSK